MNPIESHETAQLLNFAENIKWMDSALRKIQLHFRAPVIWDWCPPFQKFLVNLEHFKILNLNQICAEIFMVEHKKNNQIAVREPRKYHLREFKSLMRFANHLSSCPKLRYPITKILNSILLCLQILEDVRGYFSGLISDFRFGFFVPMNFRRISI